MKKIVLTVLSLLACSMLFAAESYTVKSVKGKVTYEASAGKFKDISVGQNLSISSVVNTGVNSTLVLTADGKEFTVKPMSKGTVESLVSAKNVAGGFKKNPAAGTKAVAAAASSTGKGVGTASERASGKGEEALEIDE